MGPILFRRNYFRNKEGAEQDIKDRIQNKIRQEEINVIRKGWLYIILIRKLRD
jgi:chemotaxis methyl-accepting protein methylase